MTDVLVLNFTYEALNLTDFQRAMRLVFLGKAEIVHRTTDLLGTVSRTFQMPSVIRMLYFIKRPPCIVALTRTNLLRRDGSQCQYCGRRDGPMTQDHVIPRSRGGQSTFENIVIACSRCNNEKGDRTPQEARMKLRRVPRAPHSGSWLRFAADRLAEVARQYVIGA